jgi:hypothetical protein
VDYKKAWEDLKAWVVGALEDGEALGFDKETPTNCNENGMYEAYTMVYEEIKNRENQK